MFKIKYANNGKNLQSELKEINKIRVVSKTSHEIKHENLVDYTGKLEMVGKLLLGDQIRSIYFRFRNMDDFECYINAIDEGYEAEDSIFLDIFIKPTLLNLT